MSGHPYPSLGEFPIGDVGALHLDECSAEVAESLLVTGKAESAAISGCCLEFEDTKAWNNAAASANLMKAWHGLHIGCADTLVRLGLVFPPHKQEAWIKMVLLSWSSISK